MADYAAATQESAKTLEQFDLTQSSTGLSIDHEQPEPFEPAPAREPEPQPETRPRESSMLKPPQKSGRFQQRISDLVGQRDQYRQEAESLRAQLAERSKPADSTTGTRPASPAQGAQPALNPDDFETYGDYVNALVDQKVAQTLQTARTQSEQQAVNQYREERKQEFMDNCAPLVEQYGDAFFDAITDPGLPISEPMVDAVAELGELAPYVMLYLANNPEDARAIYDMNPRHATLAIGRLAAQVDAELKGGARPAQREVPPMPTARPVAPMRPAAPPAPRRVPELRGATPANSLENDPGDQDDVQTWLLKEAARIRRRNPNAKFYAG